MGGYDCGTRTRYSDSCSSSHGGSCRNCMDGCDGTNCNASCTTCKGKCTCNCTCDCTCGAGCDPNDPTCDYDDHVNDYMFFDSCVPDVVPVQLANFTYAHPAYVFSLDDSAVDKIFGISVSLLPNYKFTGALPRDLTEQIITTQLAGPVSPNPPEIAILLSDYQKVLTKNPPDYAAELAGSAQPLSSLANRMLALVQNIRLLIICAAHFTLYPIPPGETILDYVAEADTRLHLANRDADGENYEYSVFFSFQAISRVNSLIRMIFEALVRAPASPLRTPAVMVPLIPFLAELFPSRYSAYVFGMPLQPKDLFQYGNVRELSRGDGTAAIAVSAQFPYINDLHDAYIDTGGERASVISARFLGGEDMRRDFLRRYCDLQTPELRWGWCTAAPDYRMRPCDVNQSVFPTGAALDAAGGYCVVYAVVYSAVGAITATLPDGQEYFILPNRHQLCPTAELYLGL
jgi:hypothetical protein